MVDNSTNINYEGTASTDIGLIITYRNVDVDLRRNRFLRFDKDNANAVVINQMLFQPYADFGSCKLCSKSTESIGFSLNYNKHVVGIFQYRQSRAKFPLAGWFTRTLASCQAEVEALDVNFAHRVRILCGEPMAHQRCHCFTSPVLILSLSVSPCHVSRSGSFFV